MASSGKQKTKKKTVFTDCQSGVHAIRVLRAHGLPKAALQEVFHGVGTAKLLYAASA